MKTLNQYLSFIRELDRLKAVYRKTPVKTDNNRFENSAEHSWHITLCAQLLHPYAEVPVDISRVTTMLLIHDVVEIDAGDTFAFADEAALAAQEVTELAAAERIFGLLPDPQAGWLKSLWLEFEQAESADARFAKAMDCILPLIQNMENDGGSWPVHQVTRSQVLHRNRHLQKLAPLLWDYACEQVDVAVQKGWLKAA